MANAKKIGVVDYVKIEHDYAQFFSGKTISLQTAREAFEFFSEYTDDEKEYLRTLLGLNVIPDLILKKDQ